MTGETLTKMNDKINDIHNIHKIEIKKEGNMEQSANKPKPLKMKAIWITALIIALVAFNVWLGFHSVNQIKTCTSSLEESQRFSQFAVGGIAYCAAVTNISYDALMNSYNQFILAQSGAGK